LDLCSLASVRECAANVKALCIPLHYVVLNAGMMVRDYEACEQEDGQKWEKTVTVNHISHFYLVHLLLDRIIEASSPESFARIVVVASHSHYMGMLTRIPNETAEFSDFPLSAAQYSKVGMRGYEQSKLCNVLFANRLQKFFTEKQLHITANSLHPASMTYSDISKNDKFYGTFLYLASFFTRSLDQACATTIEVCFSPELEGESFGGRYYDCCNAIDYSKDAGDQELAEALWLKTMKLCKINEFGIIEEK